MCFAALAGSALAESTQGIYNLLKRQLPSHASSFELSLVKSIAGSTGYDQYVVSSTPQGKILVEGTTLSALSSGYAIATEFPSRSNSDFFLDIFHDILY